MQLAKYRVDLEIPYQVSPSSLMEYHLSSLILLVLLSINLHPVTPLPSPYLSPSLFFPNYQTMLQNFKIFIYSPQTTSFPTTTESLFHTSLLNSPFITTNPEHAHLFYLHFPPNSSHKSISHTIKDLHTNFPFWNRTLGADHFYMSCNGIGYESDRNLVELKKNSIQISCFPSTEEVGKFPFIPHKDITLPPLLDFITTPISRKSYLGYVTNHHQNLPEDSVNEVSSYSDFYIAEEENEMVISNSKFCLFYYNGGGSVSGIGKALRYGCVPVVITDRLILDLPFADVLRWTEIAVFVETTIGVKELRDVLSRTCGGEKYEKLSELGKTASKHFVWNLNPEAYDAFHTVLYQLWMRRHIIRYSRSEL